MPAIFLNTMSLILLFVFTACSNKVCTDKDIYDGLYNALTCDYKVHLSGLENNISKEEAKYLKNIANYKLLNKKVLKEEHKVMEYQNNVEATETLIYDIQKKLREIDSKAEVTPFLEEISEHITKQ